MIELMKIMTYWLSFSALLVAFAAGVRGQSRLSNVTESRDSAFANYTGTVFDADGVFQLTWSVNFTEVVFSMFTANSSRSIANRTADAIIVTDTSSYSFSFDISGANITSKLSIRNPNGSYTVTLTVPGFNATFYPDTNDATMLGITNATEMGSSTEAMTTMTSTMITQTEEATITTETQTPTQTNEQLPTIPDNASCDHFVGKNCSENTTDFSFNCSREGIATNQSCVVNMSCNGRIYRPPTITCEGEQACMSLGVWGSKCDKLCGGGCPTLNDNSSIRLCWVSNGSCINRSGQIVNKCIPGWDGEGCRKPRCSNDCSPGTCLAPDLCGNCPRHYDSHYDNGKTCRNVSLDGFLKGSLPTLAILAAVVIVLKLASNWYERNKKKSE